MKKTLLVVIVPAILVMAALLLVPRIDFDSDPESHAQGQDTRAQSASRVAESPDTSIGDEDQHSTDADIALAVAKWQRASGYYMDLSGLPEDYVGEIEIIHPYQSYDNDVLRELADNNDMTAAVMLGDRLLRSKDPSVREEGIRRHEQAAVLGSTFSAIILGSEYFSRGPKGDDDNANKIEALAWYQVALDRGDPGGASSINLAVGREPLDHATAQAVCERAASIRTSLEESRRSLLLPEFDDRPPPLPDGLESDEMFVSSLNCNNG